MDHAPSAFSRLDVVAATGSTSTDLAAARAAAPQDWPHLAVLRAEHQAAGRGRLDREWVTPPGEALTASLVLLPRRPRSDWAGLTAVAGLAVVRAARGLGGEAALKWPNDVVLRDRGADLPGWGTSRKLAGVLAEVVHDARGGDAVVLGIGVNVRQAVLPVPWATSLELAGVEIAPAELLELIGVELVRLLERWERGGPAELLPDLTAASDTVGRDVRVEVAGGEPVVGHAEALDGEGRLVVVRADGSRTSVSAGDVLHLRRAGREG